MRETGFQHGQRILVFPTFDPKTFDTGMVPLFKWLIDYTFYKFGVEVREREGYEYSRGTDDRCTDHDYGTCDRRVGENGLVCHHHCVLHRPARRSVSLRSLAKRRHLYSNRPIRKIVWPIVVIYMAIAIPLQYAMHLGLPILECICEWRENTVVVGG